MPEHILTYSAMRDYRNCPRRFRNRYEHEIVPVERDANLVLGDGFHRSLESWFRLDLEGQPKDDAAIARNHLEVFQIPITTWDEFLDAAAEIAKGGHNYRTIIVDTCDNAYRYCTTYVCAKHGVKHPTDLPYGKGFALVNAEFHRVLTKLAALPYGLFLISHAQEKEMDGRTGKYIKITPTLPENARKILIGMVDMILFADLETETTPDGKPTVRRVLRTKPDRHYEAGDRTGRLPETLPLNYQAFAEAFAGKRAETAKTPKTTA